LLSEGERERIRRRGKYFLKGVVLMLSTFCSLIATVVVAYAANYVSDFIFEMLIVQKIYDASMQLAGDYLMENGRGFYKERNREASAVEWSVRIVLTLTFWLMLILLSAFLLPYKYEVWLISGLAIKIGFVLGLVLDLVENVNIEIAHMVKIGRLLYIDQELVGHFQGTYMDDYEMDLSMWNDPEGLPPLDRRYMTLDILENKAFYLLEFKKTK
jgi:hypothetical protein